MPHKECKTVSKEDCTKVPRQKCKTQPKEICKEVAHHFSFQTKKVEQKLYLGSSFTITLKQVEKQHCQEVKKQECRKVFFSVLTFFTIIFLIVIAAQNQLQEGAVQALPADPGSHPHLQQIWAIISTFSDWEVQGGSVQKVPQNPPLPSVQPKTLQETLASASPWMMWTQHSFVCSVCITVPVP